MLGIRENLQQSVAPDFAAADNPCPGFLAHFPGGPGQEKGEQPFVARARVGQFENALNLQVFEVVLCSTCLAGVLEDKLPHGLFGIGR